MNLTIHLPAEMEAALLAQAASQGLDLSQYVENVLREQVPARPADSAGSPASRAAAWREAARGLPITPPLSDDAISRESLYGDHGR